MKWHTQAGVAALLALTATVGAQQEPVSQPEPPMSPAEVVRLFDAYAVMQAQDALGLDAERYGTFVAGYRALLEVRRKHQLDRLRLVAELGTWIRQTPMTVSEADLRRRLEEIDALDAAAAADTRRAQAAVEKDLTVLERARFRVFEQQMERRKLELLSRARQGRPAMRRPPR